MRGAFATFLTMAYILFVNPQILSTAGVPRDSAVACTAAAAAICCVLMGVVANFPMALASGMGINAMVAYQLAGKTGSWQIAMGLVVLNGLLILILVLLGLREAVIARSRTTFASRSAPASGCSSRSSAPSTAGSCGSPSPRTPRPSPTATSPRARRW